MFYYRICIQTNYKEVARTFMIDAINDKCAQCRRKQGATALPSHEHLTLTTDFSCIHGNNSVFNYHS